jgi:molybdopterin molybdotransferase
VRAGDVVLAAGATIDPASVAVLAAVGKGRCAWDAARPSSVLATGDELVDVWDTPQGARIRNSNGYAVAAQALWAGAQVTSLGTVPDHPERIADAVRAGFASDVLLVSGGVSRGAYDLVEDVLERFDVGLLFTRVAVKPGAPLVFGRRGDRLVFGLPATPSRRRSRSTCSSARRCCGCRARVCGPPRPARRAQGGRRQPLRSPRLPAGARGPGGRRGWCLADPLQGSGDLVAHARANALVALDPERTRAEAGELGTPVPLGNFLERSGG